jgi:hypothetical protein
MAPYFNRMKITSTTSPQMPLPMGTQSNPPPASNKMEQDLARIRDSIAERMSRLEKSMARAHFTVGKIVLQEPTLLALVAPHLEAHVSKLGSARNAVDNYAATVAELKRLGSLTL